MRWCLAKEWFIKDALSFKNLSSFFHKNMVKSLSKLYGTISKRKINEAKNIVRKICKINGTEFPNIILDDISLQEKTEADKNKSQVEGTLGQMFRSKRFFMEILFDRSPHTSNFGLSHRIS